jgi:hypothetical protein
MKRLPQIIASIAVLTGASACHARSDVTGDLTIINRTTAEVTVTDGNRDIRVPACGETTAHGFRINGWELTSQGRDTFTGGNGNEGPQTYILVTEVPTQTHTRPNSLPPCRGLLQEGNAS